MATTSARRRKRVTAWLPAIGVAALVLCLLAAAPAGAGLTIPPSAVPTGPAAKAGGAVSTARLTAAQRQELGDLAAKFRRAAKTPEERTPLVDKALAFGDPAPAMLLDLVNKELQPLRQKYRADFLKRAGDLLRDKARDSSGQPINALRQTVLDLGKDAGLTHETLVAKADPAMAELNKLMMLDPSAVLADAPALASQRTAMAEIGRHWERLVEHLAAASPAAAAGPSNPGPPPPVPPGSPTKIEDLLREDDSLGVLLALAPDDNERRVLLANADLEPKIQAEEARGIRDLNRIRLLLGLKALRIDVPLCEAARDHSKDMVTKEFFAHDSRVPGKKTPWDRAKRFGTSAGAENIAAGNATGAGTNQQWFRSPGHHRNMLGSHNRVGLGRHEKTWTQMFGG